MAPKISKRLLAGLGLVALLTAMASLGLWQHNGAYGFNVLLRRGGSFWLSVGREDPLLSPAMQMALKTPVLPAASGPLLWRELEKGFEVADLSVVAGGSEVDTIMLSRIDPTRFRFTVRNAANGDKGIDEWEKALPKSVLIVNGSYYGKKGEPDTPVISQGLAMGPQSYEAHAGAFVTSEGVAAIKDLRSEDWRNAYAGAHNAMVAYPLLIGSDGETHVPVKSQWLANRTFVGQDAAGRIVIGTTKEAFFSLDRLAVFLKNSPLNLKTTLNLDGGPIACQSLRFPAFSRKFYAKWEAQANADEVKLLRWPLSNATWAMPMVLAVERREPL